MSVHVARARAVFAPPSGGASSTVKLRVLGMELLHDGAPHLDRETVMKDLKSAPGLIVIKPAITETPATEKNPVEPVSARAKKPIADLFIRGHLKMVSLGAHTLLHIVDVSLMARTSLFHILLIDLHRIRDLCPDLIGHRLNSVLKRVCKDRAEHWGASPSDGRIAKEDLARGRRP